MRKFLIGAGFILLATVAALAANISYNLGPIPSGDKTAAVNGFINNFNAGMGGVVAYLPAAVATTDTSADVLFSYTVQPNTLKTGQTLTIYAYGFNPADANVRTLTFNFGSAGTCAVVITGSAALWWAEVFVTEVATSSQSIECHGQHGTTRLTSAQSTATEDVTTALLADVTITTATSGITTLRQAVATMLR